MHMDDVPQRRWVMAGGQQIFARVWARASVRQRTPVVLVHGLGLSSRYMVPTAIPLSAHRCVYAPDLPGFGRSSRPWRALTVVELAAVLTDWMRTVGVGRAVLLGNSLGCQIVAHMAVDHPEMVERAILVGPTMDSGAGAFALVGRLLVDGLVEPYWYLPPLISDYLRAGLVRTLATFRYALHDDTLTIYEQMPMPTLIVRGEYDPIVPQKWAEQLAARLPNGRLAVIARAGHTVNYIDPHQLIDLTCQFLDAAPS